MRIVLLLATTALIGVATGCTRGDDAKAASTAQEAALEPIGCDHDVSSTAVARNSWPYPANERHLLWTGRYDRMELKLKPTHAAFVTATMTFREGDFVEVLDSEVHVTKPRRLVAKRDIYVTREVTSQGIEKKQRYLVAKEGEVASFLFYNSEGFCIVSTSEGPAWTPCTLDDTFEGLSAATPYACAQNWWVQVQRNKIDKGWMIVNPSHVQRVAAPPDGAK